MLKYIITVYLILFNLIGFFIMLIDKKKLKSISGELRNPPYFLWLLLAVLLVCF